MNLSHMDTGVPQYVTREELTERLSQEAKSYQDGSQFGGETTALSRSPSGSRTAGIMSWRVMPIAFCFSRTTRMSSAGAGLRRAVRSMTGDCTGI